MSCLGDTDGSVPTTKSASSSSSTAPPHLRRRDDTAMTETEDNMVSVRYIVDDVQAAIDFYTAHLGFTMRTAHLPAFADVTRGPLRLLLSGPASSGARATPSDATTPGRNRIHLIVDSLDAEIDRLRGAGCRSAATQSPAPAGARSCSPTLP